jgi:hypothetical protein
MTAPICSPVSTTRPPDFGGSVKAAETGGRPLPYTHAMHAALCRHAARSGTVPDAVHVQTKLGRQVVCARIVTAWDTADGLEMWQLDLLGPIHGRMSIPTSRVLQCSHLDGLCSCEAKKS